MFSDFPNLHPLVVHFPIVLILTSAALQALLVFKDWQPVRWITLGVMAGGFAGALAASTVFHAMPTGLTPKATAIFSAHEQYAGYALWLSGITLLLGGVGEYFQLRRRAFEILVLVAALAAAGSVSVAGHHGAQLVYIEGVGPKGNLVMKGDHRSHGGADEMPGMEMGAPGTDQHGEAAGHREEDHNEPATGPGQQRMPPMGNNTDMKGMDMKRPESPQKVGVNQAMDGMDMSSPKKPGRPQQAPVQGKMPGMKMPNPKNRQQMPKGMDMRTQPNQPAMGNMAGMKGMDMKPAGTKQPRRTAPAMKGVGNMENMPGMSMPGPKKSAPNAPPMGDMKNMPGMNKDRTMPGMAMPNTMDKYRFEDNNPAREKPKQVK